MKKITLTLALFFFIFSSAFATNYCENANNEGCWPFEGNANDASSNGYDGTVNGATDTTTSPPAAYSTHYYSFNGSSDYMTLTAMTAMTTSVSLSVWLYADSDAAAYKYIFTHQDTDGWPITEFRIDQGGDLYELISSDGVSNGHFFTVRAGGFPYAEWVHVAAVKTWSTTTGAAIYENGVSQTLTVNNTGVPSGVAETIREIGRRPSQNYWNGDMDELARFSDLLSEAEVNDIMDNGLVQAVSTTLVDYIYLIN